MSSCLATLLTLETILWSAEPGMGCSRDEDCKLRAGVALSIEGSVVPGSLFHALWYFFTVKPPTRARPIMGATKAAIEIRGTQVPRLCRKMDGRTARMMAIKRVRRAIFLMRRCHLNN